MSPMSTAGRVFAIVVLAMTMAVASAAVSLVLLVRLNDLGETNRRNTDRTVALTEDIRRNQEGVDELVTFVRELQADDSASSSSGLDQIIARIFTLLCATDDPVRLAKCAELGIT